MIGRAGEDQSEPELDLYIANSMNRSCHFFIQFDIKEQIW